MCRYASQFSASPASKESVPNLLGLLERNKTQRNKKLKETDWVGTHEIFYFFFPFAETKARPATQTLSTTQTLEDGEGREENTQNNMHIKTRAKEIPQKFRKVFAGTTEKNKTG